MRLILALLAIVLTTSFPVSGGTDAGSFDEIRLRLIDLNEFCGTDREYINKD